MWRSGKSNGSAPTRSLSRDDPAVSWFGGVRMSVDGTTAVDGAHIHQLKKGGPDDPRNGMALSKTAHWLFDRGFWPIGEDYTVLVKVDRFDEAGGADQLLKRRINQRIHLPRNQEVWPGREYLAWHREAISKASP